jgi:hypothetical protein
MVPLGDRLMSTEAEAGLGWEEGKKGNSGVWAAIVRPARSEEKITA